MESFGHFIRTKREDLGMPLRKLAALLDIDQSTLSKIERNEREPNKEMLPRLAKAFKLTDKEVAYKILG
jgi:transcriptional regulator with XRE-family HTH domain